MPIFESAITGYTSSIPRYSDNDIRYLEERHRDEIRSLRHQFEYELANRINRDIYLRSPWLYADSFYGRGIVATYPYPTLFQLTQKEVSLPVATKTHIIIGTSGAAAHPTTHTTLADAEKEATRLAKKTPGEEFTIYTTTKSFKVEDKPVTVKTFI